MGGGQFSQSACFGGGPCQIILANKNYNFFSLNPPQSHAFQPVRFRKPSSSPLPKLSPWGCLYQWFSGGSEGDKSCDSREQDPDQQEPPPVQLHCEIEGNNPHLKEGHHLKHKHKHFSSSQLPLCSIRKSRVYVVCSIQPDPPLHFQCWVEAPPTDLGNLGPCLTPLFIPHLPVVYILSFPCEPLLSLAWLTLYNGLC